MAKRFIDTGFLDQKWIRKLTPERKIFVVYLMLQCDNGGVIDLDMEDAEFWIGKKVGNPIQFLPEGFLIPVIDDKHFIPKFLKWQYPNFPHSRVHQQKQAIQILTDLQIFDVQNNTLHESYLNFTQTLPNSKVNGNVNDNVDDNASDTVNEPVKEKLIFPFDSEEFLKWWNLWKEYKHKEHKFKYKSSISEQAALKKVSELAGGDELKAISILEQSMAQGWAGLFELTVNNNKQYNNDPATRAAMREKIGAEFARKWKK